MARIYTEGVTIQNEKKNFCTRKKLKYLLLISICFILFQNIYLYKKQEYYVNLNKELELEMNAILSKNIKKKSDLDNYISTAIEKDYLQVDEILHYQINDDIYYILTKKYVELFLELDNTNNLKYSSNKNDCDDFAHILYGNLLLSEYNTEKLKNASLTFGVVYGIYNNDYHAYNIFYANDNFYCIEPQEDEIGLCNEFIYRPRLILI
tara:strand:- start:1290 stop:1913 length:624 start_codon:yes stop_codon:yes gene_type:complete